MPTLIGILCALSGAAFLVIATASPDTLLALMPSLGPMGLNTALCFLLGGIALSVTTAEGSMAQIRVAASISIVAIAGAVLLQIVADQYPPYSLLWQYLLNTMPSQQSSGTWPGMMSVPAAIAFLLAGVAMASMGRARKAVASVVIQIMIGAILIIAVLGLANTFVANAIFFSRVPLGGTMSPFTAAGLLLVGLGIISAYRQTDGCRQFFAGREDRQIFVVSVSLMLIFTICAGLFFGVFLARKAFRSYQDTLDVAFHANEFLFRETLREAENTARMAVNMSQLRNLMAADHLPGDVYAIQEAVQRMAGSVEAGSMAVTVLDVNGQQIATTGGQRGPATLRVPVSTGKFSSWLVWRNGWYLETQIPVLHLGRELGRARIEIAMPNLTAQFDYTRQVGQTGEVLVCAKEGADMVCFPSRLSPQVHREALAYGGQLIPMGRALQGERGSIVVVDYRGREVVSAFAPVGETGLGMVQKIDLQDLSYSLGVRFWQAIVVLLALVLLGALLISRFVRPIVAELLRTRMNLGVILDSIPSAILTTDAHGTIESANHGAELIFEQSAQEMVGVCIECLLSEPVFSDGCLGNRKTNEIVVRRRDGSALVVEAGWAEFLVEKKYHRVYVIRDITARKRSEDALRESRASLANAQRIAHIGNWDWDIEHGTVEWSDEAYRLVGQTRGVITPIFEAFLGMIHPAERVKVDLAVKHALEGGADYDVHFRVNLPEGKERMIHAQGEVDFDNTGKPVRMSGTMQDVTAQHAAECALRRSEANLARAQRIAHLGSWEWDMESGRVERSKEWYHIFRRARDSMPPTSDAFLELVHPEDRPRLLEAIKLSVEKGQPFDIDMRIVRSDGSVAVIYEQGEVEFDLSGKPVRMFGTTLDITERKRIEEQLHQREQEFRALVDHSPDIVSRFDRDMRRIYVNPAIEVATGKPPEYFLGKCNEELDIPPEVGQAWTQSVKEVFLTGQADTFDFAFPTPSGPRQYQVWSVPERNTEGEVNTVLTVARDISVLKGVESVLRESEERLHGITSNIPGMVFQCVIRSEDRAIIFTYVSGGALHLFGISAAMVQLDPAAFLRHLAENDEGGFHAAMRNSAETLGLWNWEGRIVSEHGEAKWINLRATPRRTRSDDTIWDGVIFNITDSKINEDRLRESQELLRQLSAHREAVREEERKRIAREVHDELGQTLTALRMDVSLLRLNFGGENVDLMNRIKSMTELVDRTIQATRHVTSTLRPAALDLGIVAALEWLAEEFTTHAGIPCFVTAGDGNIALDDTRATTLFRVVQEALTNVARHAKASHVDVMVEQRGDQLYVEVCDNGCGFDAHAPKRVNAYGLVGIRERAIMLGGKLEILSSPGQGTKVMVEFSL